jgi:hypothetical protein
MNVGDLVKVYDFTHVARQRLGAKVQPRGLEIDAHYVGLIMRAPRSLPGEYHRVLRCVDGEWEDYNVNRLEVIA